MGPRGNRTKGSTFECPVCFTTAVHFSVGICNHSICQECSVRMRVLLGANECPIVSSLLNEFFDRKSGIRFENEDVQRKFKSLVQHVCSICEDHVGFPNLKQLETHCQRKHELFYCQLCSEHLNLFNMKDASTLGHLLATHRRKGDRDDKSHKGHPCCEFCNQRFMDNEALFLHLRKENITSVISATQMGKNNTYYPNYDTLRDHFGEQHYLCTEPSCKDSQFTHAFKSEIDFKVEKSVPKWKSSDTSRTQEDFPSLGRPSNSAPPLTTNKSQKNVAQRIRDSDFSQIQVLIQGTLPHGPPQLHLIKKSSQTTGEDFPGLDPPSRKRNGNNGKNGKKKSEDDYFNDCMVGGWKYQATILKTLQILFLHPMIAGQCTPLKSVINQTLDKRIQMILLQTLPNSRDPIPNQWDCVSTPDLFVPNEATGAKPKSTAPPPPPGFHFNSKQSKANNTEQTLPFGNVRSTYNPPKDFAVRNKKLLSLITRILGGKSLEFKEFMNISKSFVMSLSAQKGFYDKCVEIVSDNNKLMEFLPELIFLLPDIKKQQELHRLHQKKNSFLKIVYLEECDKCNQLLSSKDISQHRNSHSLDGDFPSFMSYLDLHDIVATASRIPVKTNDEALPSLGFVDPSLGLEDLPDNYKFELPLWMVLPLIRHGLEPDYPNPALISTKNGRYLISKIGTHPFAEKLGKILPDVLRKRFRMIMDSSQHAGDGDALHQKAKLDILERELFSQGQESKRQATSWFKRKTGQIQTATMVSRHYKRKASVLE
ncbi:ZNF598 [Lepeophtheirus salmonis]|uniref:ZNF598 n=1 Tax=Lepeophtheirus salmonis TaxID=72036 RepID=A0A817F9I7_LEPSM|nr:ZNF598 [Lepeophtheirus salmonis]CAG9475430.1 ZNF598 [Lepeophtheirus salmonis]